MDIELFAGTTIAKISRDGGYVTNLADNNGDILFPKRTLSTPGGQQKVRGGSHVCAPNFGPGGGSGQPQHGFARSSAWGVLQQSDNKVVLSLAGREQYEGVELQLTYAIATAEFTSTLKITNNSGHGIVVAPAFHPYFMTDGEVELNGVVQPNLADYSEAVFKSGTKHILRTNGRFITLMSSTFSTWAVWTDQLAPYLCVEPTHSGFSFDEDMTRADTIAIGETRSYDFLIQWANL